MENVLAVSDTIIAKETMTSLEIAEVTGKEHDKVCRDIDNLLEQGVSPANFGESNYTNERGKTYRCYILTKKGSLILASGYNAVLREKIINRWEQLEIEKRNGGFEIPKTLSSALMLAAKQAEQIEQQKEQLQLQAPKVLFAEAVKTSDKSILIGELAKILRQNGYETGERRLFDYFRRNEYLCNRGEKYNQPTHSSMEREFFEITKTTITRPNGIVLTKTTTKVTVKGQIYFINKFLGKIA